jgi:hypothetical protein
VIAPAINTARTASPVSTDTGFGWFEAEQFGQVREKYEIGASQRRHFPKINPFI